METVTGALFICGVSEPGWGIDTAERAPESLDRADESINTDGPA